MRFRTLSSNVNEEGSSPNELASMQSLKKARLVEDQMSYVDLAPQANFSDEELTDYHFRKIIKDRKDQQAIQKVKKIEQAIMTLKQVTRLGIRAVLETIHKVDENSQKIVFKHFDQSNVNILAK